MLEGWNVTQTFTSGVHTMLLKVKLQHVEIMSGWYVQRPLIVPCCYSVCTYTCDLKVSFTCVWYTDQWWNQILYIGTSLRFVYCFHIFTSIPGHHVRTRMNRTSTRSSSGSYQWGMYITLTWVLFRIVYSFFQITIDLWVSYLSS